MLPLIRMKVLAIIHGSRKIPAVHARFLAACKEDPTLEFTQSHTTQGGHATTLAREAKGRVELLILHGGDGLINEVVNGLCAKTGLNPKVFILPGGTGNDFIRNFKRSDLLTTTPFELFQQQGSQIQVPFCQSELDIRYFINIADVGFGGHVVQSLNRFRATLGVKASYFLSVIRTFISYKAQELSLSFNNNAHTQRYFMVAICHGSTFGNGMIIAPGKDPKLPQFRLVILGDVSLWDYLKNLPKLKRGIEISHPEIHYEQATSVDIATAKNLMLGETDGEFIQGKSFHLGFSDQIIQVIC
jgi:diacylglycerol kinase (ATP)